MTRFVHVETPINNPGQCFLCRKAECVRGFVDTLVQDDWAGSYYVCGDCAVEMGRVFGMSSKEDTERRNAVNALLSEDLAKLQAENETLNDIKGLVVNFRESRNATGDNPVDAPRRGPGRPRVRPA